MKKLPNPTKAKEHYELFLKNKGKNINKALKTVKKNKTKKKKNKQR